MAKPTHEDADLMLQLVRSWPVEATDWIWSDEFIPDYKESAAKDTEAGEGSANIRAVLNWYETIGTLHKHGLLNEDLLFDWLAIDLTWDRMKSHALGRRAEIGNPHMYENFEAMANAQTAWTASRDREAA
jgi:hypothetical protein